MKLTNVKAGFVMRREHSLDSPARHQAVVAHCLRACLSFLRWLEDQNGGDSARFYTLAFAVEWLARDLEADYAVGTGWQTEDTVRHFWPENKASYFEALLSELNLGRNVFAATGDSLGDISMLNLASKNYFVGHDLPPELSHTEHWPDANINKIVSNILE